MGVASTLHSTSVTFSEESEGVVVRRSTERPETVGTVARLVAVGPDIATAVRDVIARGEPGRAALAGLTCPYGDGAAGPASATAITAHYPA